MNRIIIVFVILSTALCLLSPVYAFGGTPPPAPAPTEDVETAPTASDEALAKEQIENLRRISIESKNLGEGTGKFLKDLREGKRYLYEFNKIAKEELLRIASDKNEDWKFRFAAVGFTDANNPPEAFETLREIIEDKNEMKEIRTVAIGAISRSTNAKTDDILIKVMKQDNVNIMARAASVLGERKSQSAVQSLIEITTYWWGKLSKNAERGERSDSSIGSEDEDLLLLNCIRALGQIGDDRAVTIFEKILDGKHLLAAKEFSATALGEIKGDVAVDLLVDILTDKDDLDVDLKAYAIESLSKIGDEKSVIALKKMLKNDNDFLKQKAMAALEEISRR